MPTLAILGRPNVGKSTLFNRLVGKRLALVHDRPGVTRDWRLHEASLAGLRFELIDTAGLEEETGENLEARTRRQTAQAIARADILLFMIDARAGVTPLDEQFAGELRRTDKPVLLLANKVEGAAAEPGVIEAWRLGLGDPIAVSAEHGLGLDGLYEALAPMLDQTGLAGDGSDEGEGDKPIQLAIVGRPNVGKSTLVNALIGEERLLTGPEPGVTRDAIPVDWRWQDQAIRLVDTAGLRRKARVSDQVEQMAGGETIRAIRLAQVVVLVLDGSAILDKQDLAIASHVVEEGRALVIAVNKWDAVEDREAALQRLSDRLQTSLTQNSGVPTVTISALEGRKLGKLLDTVLETYRLWDMRVTTGRLNRWLAAMLEAHPPPLVAGRRVKLRYITQIKARPPTFALFTSRPEKLPEAYRRYLINGLREAFGIEGVPIRLLLRKGENPYADKG